MSADDLEALPLWIRRLESREAVPSGPTRRDGPSMVSVLGMVLMNSDRRRQL
jgi:hypothetical protein